MDTATQRALRLGPNVPNIHFTFDTRKRAGVCASVGVWMRGEEVEAEEVEGGRQ